MNGLCFSFCVAALGAALLPTASAGQNPGLSAGKWEMTSTVTSIDLPGAPPAVTQMMLGKPVVVSICVTPDMAAKGQTAKPDPDCDIKSSISGSRISSEMTCHKAGSTISSSSTGTYTATSFNSTGTSKVTGRSSMTESVKVSGRRVGTC